MKSNIRFEDLPKKMKPFVKTLLNQSKKMKTDIIEVVLMFDECESQFSVNVESDHFGFIFDMTGILLYTYNWQE